MSMRHWLPRVALAGAVGAAIVWVVLNSERLDPEALDDWLSGLGFWAPLAYLAIYAAGTVAFLPGLLFALAGGALFGPIWGALLNLLGGTLGATLAFLLARYVAGDWVSRRAGGRLQALVAGVEAEGWRFVAFLRLVPLFPFNLVNYALGLTRIGLVPYVVASLVCMAPGAIAYTWLGHAGREALAGDTSAVRYGLLALGLLAAVVFLPRLVGRLRRRPTGRIEASELHRRLHGDSGITVLDVRGPDEFAGPLGHIPEAANLPLGQLLDRLTQINAPKHEPIILVCRTDKRSASAAALLRGAGFTDVRVLRGGMERWRALGFGVR